MNLNFSLICVFQMSSVMLKLNFHCRFFTDDLDNFVCLVFLDCWRSELYTNLIIPDHD